MAKRDDHIIPARSLATGWYGIPGSERPGTKVHVVRDSRPLCGYRPAKSMEFQFCSWGVRYVECDRCRERAERLCNPREAS